MTSRCALLFLSAAALAACSHHASGTVDGISYTLPLDGSYRVATPPRWHEDIWYADAPDAPIVSVRVQSTPTEEGHEPHCTTEGRGVGTNDALVFYPDRLDRPRDGKSVSLAACSPSHPTRTIMCSVYFRSGQLDRARASTIIEPCRGLHVD